MTFHRIAAVVLRNIYLVCGSFPRTMPLFAWVAVDIVLWGLITRYLNTVASSGFDFVPALLGAVLLWDFFGRVMQGVTTAFFEDVWSRNFLNIFASPISVGEYVGGLVITSILTSAIGLLVMLVLAGAFFKLSFSLYGPAVFAFLLVLFLFGIALGILGSAVVLGLGPSAEWLIWPIPALLSPFAGVFYPISTLPAWMRYISYLLPPSYVFENMRSILSGEPIQAAALLWGGGLAALYVLAAGFYFSRTYKHVARSGLLARYSAESAG